MRAYWPGKEFTFGSQRIFGLRRVPFAAGVVVAFVAAVLPTFSAGAGEVDPEPSEPVLTSIGTDRYGHITAAWEPASGLGDVRGIEFLWNATGAVEGGGGETGASGGETVASSATSHITRNVFDPGSYYVQVCYSDAKQGDFCSDVRSVVVPDSGTLRATATVERGSAEIVRRDGSRAPLNSETILRPGDTIRTHGDRALAVLTFADGSKVALGPDSSFRLEGDTTLAGVLGKLRLLLKRRYRVRTPNACACVRGTVLTVEATRKSTRLRVYEHSVRFFNRGRRKPKVTVRAGFESSVRGAKPPTRPQRFKPPKHPFWQ